MNLLGLKSEVLSAFLVGMARYRPDYQRVVGNELPANDAKVDLKAAALLAQALRLERPAMPAEFALETALSGRRKIMPDELREPFIRMFGTDKFALPPQGNLAFGMALALERWFLAPHPYDFHRIEGFLRVHADRLGADVLAWLDRDKASEEQQRYFDLAVLTDDTWTEATPVRRERYISERRRTDPAAARALVEATWANETADIRLSLLGGLRVRLGSEDRAFLESLAKDRAPKVRDLAAALLSKLPGMDGISPAQEKMLGRISKGTAGIFRKRPVLKLELPATVPNSDVLNWVIADFSDIAIEICLDRLGMSDNEVITAAAEDEGLTAAMTLMAVQSRRFDIVTELAGRSSIPCALLACGAFNTQQNFSCQEAIALCEALFRPGAKLDVRAFKGAVTQLHALTQTTIPSSSFDIIVKEVEMHCLTGDAAETGTILTQLALLAPTARRDTLRSLAQRHGDGGSPVIAWLDLLDNLEKASTHE